MESSGSKENKEGSENEQTNDEKEENKCQHENLATAQEFLDMQLLVKDIADEAFRNKPDLTALRFYVKENKFGVQPFWFVNTPYPIFDSPKPQIALSTFISDCTKPLEEQKMQPGRPLTWLHCGKMGVIFRIVAPKQFCLQSGSSHPNVKMQNKICFGTMNTSGQYEIFVPTGIPIAWSLFHPLYLSFMDNAQVPFAVYGHRWLYKDFEKMPSIKQCVVPVKRNYIYINGLLSKPLFNFKYSHFGGF